MQYLLFTSDYWPNRETQGTDLRSFSQHMRNESNSCFFSLLNFSENLKRLLQASVPPARSRFVSLQTWKVKQICFSKRLQTRCCLDN